VENRHQARRLVWLYALVLLLYAALASWWVYFFWNQADWIEAHVRGAGGALTDVQIDVLRDVTAGTARMFLMESGFLFLLLAGSAVFVLRALRREQALLRQQRNFLAAITHELRSPVASARLYLESLKLGRVEPEKQARYLQHAGEDLQRLSDTIDELLEGRRLLERGLAVHPEPLELAEYLRPGLARLTALHAAAGATLSLDAPAPVTALADPVAVDRILDNLVSNGVKHGGSPARVEVALRAHGRWAELSVRDHGPGLAGVDPERLFAPFVRGGDESVRSRPGVGLGLFIVHELARLHGGDVRAEDGLPGGGARFTVRLPLEGTAHP
jgi:two-component system, OmpR family, phosphate regulon sensor histidine kinase PhoR